MNQLKEQKNSKDREASRKSSKTLDQKIQIYEPVAQALLTSTTQLISNIIMPNNTQGKNNIRSIQQVKIMMEQLKNQLYQKCRQLDRQMKQHQWQQFENYFEGERKLKSKQQGLQSYFNKRLLHIQQQIQKFQISQLNMPDPIQKIQKTYQNKQLKNVQFLTIEEKWKRSNIISDKQKNASNSLYERNQSKNNFQQKQKSKEKAKTQKIQETMSEKQNLKKVEQVFFYKQEQIINARQKINSIIPSNLKGFKILSQTFSKIIQKILQMQKKIFQDFQELTFEITLYLITSLYKANKSLLQNSLEKQLGISSRLRDLLRQEIYDKVQQIEQNERIIIRSRINSMRMIMNEKLAENSSTENKKILKTTRLSLEDFRNKLEDKADLQQNSFFITCVRIKQLLLQLQSFKEKEILSLRSQKLYNMRIKYEQQREKCQKQLQGQFLKHFLGLSQITFYFILFFFLLKLKPHGFQNADKIQNVCQILVSLNFFDNSSFLEESLKKIVKIEIKIQSPIQEIIRQQDQLRIYKQQNLQQSKLKDLRARLMKQLNLNKKNSSNIFQKLLAQKKQQNKFQQQYWKKLQLKYQKIKQDVVNEAKIIDEIQDEEQFLGFEQSLIEQSKKSEIKKILQ